jgi:hypothetical protein
MISTTMILWVAVCRAVEPIDRLGRDVERRIEAEGAVRSPHIVVDGLGEGDDRHAVLGQLESILHGPAPAEADERFQVVLGEGVEHRVAHVEGRAPDFHPVHLVATRTENRAALGEDARQGL